MREEWHEDRESGAEADALCPVLSSCRRVPTASEGEAQPQADRPPVVNAFLGEAIYDATEI
jgi:hypothetical protein